MANYVIYLRDGIKIPVKCDKFSITYSNISGKAIDYSYKNAAQNEPIFLDTNEIIAVIKVHPENPINEENTNEDGFTIERWP